MKYLWILFCRIPIEISMLIENHFPAKRWDRLGEFKLLFWQPEMAMQPSNSFITLVQKRGQFSLRSVGLPCDTLLLVFITTCLIVKLPGGKHRVRFFPFNSLISISDTSAPKPPKCPPNFMWRAREWSVQCLGRNRSSKTFTRQFCVTKTILIKKEEKIS